MHQLMVLYPQPDSPEPFLEYYRNVHLKLVARLPGVLTYRYGQPQPLGPQRQDVFLVFEAVFASEEALMAALRSEAGQAVAADVPNYSPKGCTLMHFGVVTAGADR